MANGILYTIDFADASRDTLKWVIKFSIELNLKITILYSYRLPVNMKKDIIEWKRKMEAEVQQKFNDIEEELLKDSGVKYELKIEVGFITDRIKDHIGKNLIRFLIMNKSMFAKSKDAFDELVDHLEVPLVILPDN